MSFIILSCTLCDRSYESNREFKEHKKVYHPKISNFRLSSTIFDTQKSPERNFKETSREIVDLDDDIMIIDDQNDLKDRKDKNDEYDRRDKPQVSDKIDKAIKSLYSKNVKSRAGPKSSKKALTLVPKLTSRGPLSKKSDDPKGLKTTASLKDQNSKSMKLENLKNLGNAVAESLDFREFWTNTDKQPVADAENTDFSDLEENQ